MPVAKNCVQPRQGRWARSYGFGRSVCFGRHKSNDAICINIIAIVLWGASKIERKKDTSGQLAPLDVDGFIRVFL
jgi:hypothetical protein